MRRSEWTWADAAWGAALLLCACGSTERAETTESAEASDSADAESVQLCDGETRVPLDPEAPVTSDTGVRIAGELMAQWQAKNPDARWALDDDPAHAIVQGNDNEHVLASADNQGPSHTYGNHSARDVETWNREVRRTVEHGDAIFHDANALGSTIAVSCDMCHPHAANTHPETYPKFQVQMGRVALLRDMINWCLEHPVRAPRMDPDDPRMRAMEAYIYAQRRGKPLDYGRR